MFLGQPVLRELLRKEEPSCDVQIFIMGIARELDHLAAIEEWWRDGVKGIGRTDEKNLRKINRHVNVNDPIDHSYRVKNYDVRTCQGVYIEGDVLFRSEHLEQGSRRVPVIV